MAGHEAKLERVGEALNGELTRVLLVEDNPAYARLIQLWLSENQASVKLLGAERLSQAVERVSDPGNGIQACLLDLSLPDGYGLDTLHRLQAAAPKLPIVILTGRDDEDLGAEAVRRGAQEFLVKGQVDGPVIARSIRYAIERKRWEEVLKENEAMLQDARSGRAIRALVQGLAHEIRNPLFAIDVNVAALGKHVAHNGDAETFMAHIHTHVRRLDGLMRDLMELGHPVSGREFFRSDLAQLLGDSRALLENLNPEAVGRIVLDLPPEPVALACVPHMLTQAFFQLLHNAGQSARGSSPITVKVRRTEGGIEASVSDLGEGIPDAILPRLFQPFTTAHQGRAGLGLALVKHYIEAHGGTVSGKNRTPGKGAVFTVFLPEAPPQVRPQT